jgi:hypothetical protein
VSIGMQPTVVYSQPNAGIDMLNPAWPPSSRAGVGGELEQRRSGDFSSIDE